MAGELIPWTVRRDLGMHMHLGLSVVMVMVRQECQCVGCMVAWLTGREKLGFGFNNRFYNRNMKSIELFALQKARCYSGNW